MIFQIPTKIVKPCLPALLTASLLGFSLPSYSQTKPEPPATQNPATTLNAPPKRSKDWWVLGLLGSSITIAGVGIIFMIKRSPPPVTEAPPPVAYKPPEPQPTATITDSVAQSTGPRPWRPKSAARATDPTETPPANVPELVELEESQLELTHALDSETTTIATTVRIPKASVMDSLVHELRNSDPAKRHKAIWELGRCGDSRAVQPMVDLLLDSDSRQRSLLLSALSEIGTRILRPMSHALAISIQDENPDVRKNAIRDLTRIYDSLIRISQLLQNACEDPDPEVQDTAKWAIGQINRIKSPFIQDAGQGVIQPERSN